MAKFTSDPAQDLNTCKLLYIDLQKKSQKLVDFTNDVLETELQGIINDPHSDRLVLEMACKVYFLLLAKKYNQIDLGAVLNLKSPRASNYIVRGILATRYDFANPDLLHSIIMTAVETCLTENSIYTTIALKNLHQFCLNYKNFTFDFRELWRLVALHLSSRFIGAREEALLILEFIVKYDTNLGLEIARLVSEEWPWTFANKFYVLRTVIERSYCSSALLDQLQLTPEDLVDGLLIALKYRALLTPGQLLLRSLLRKDQLPVVSQFMLRLIQLKDLNLLHIFYVQWSKEIFQFREELFPSIKVLIPDVSAEERLLLQNIFKDQLVVESMTELEDTLSTDPVAKQHYYEILLFRVAKEKSLSMDLSRMFRFLEAMKEDNNTTLRQFLFSSLPQFIAALIKVHAADSTSEKDRTAIEEFFRELVDKIIVPGLKATDSEYPEITLSVRMYHVLLNSLHSTNKSSQGENLRFQRLLHDKGIFTGLSMQFYKFLINQLTSAFDDIRERAVSVVLQFFVATHERRTYVEEISCEKMYFSTMDDTRRIHGYFKILVPYYETLQLDTRMLYREYKGYLVDNFTSRFSPDPLQSINCGIQVLDKINILQEIVLAKKQSSEELLELMQMLLRVSTRMLHFLSLAQGKGANEDDINPSFQVIDKSLQLLVNNSGRAEQEWDYSLDLAAMELEVNVTKRKNLLLAIWLTLKSCGDLSATIIEVTDTHDCPELFAVAIEINTDILHRCRHKGAIEAVGLSFGRIVAHVSSSKCLLPAYEQLDLCLKLLFESITSASYSRRGAGFSLLILNLIKNDRQPGRSFLQKSLATIFRQLSDDSLLISVHGAFLHYLSVLVNDSSLTQDILPHFNEIISLCLEKIESPEWSVRNGALQLFGAIVPKVIGQRQHSDTEWEPCQYTIEELQATMPKIHAFVEFCLGNHRKISRTLLIAVLSFLSNVERRPMSHCELTAAIDAHLFRLLSHPFAKVRSLSALCFARLRSHCEFAELSVKLIGVLFTVHDPNLQHGILMTLLYFSQKARLECEASEWKEGRQRIRVALLAEINKRSGGSGADVQAFDGDQVLQRTGLCDFNQLYLTRFINEIGLTDITSKARLYSGGVTN